MSEIYKNNGAESIRSGERQYLSAAHAQLTEATTWTLADFRRICILGIQVDKYPSQTPNAFELGSLLPAIERLAQDSLKDGRERGRAGLVHLKRDQLGLGRECIGTDKMVAIIVELPAGESPSTMRGGFMIHVHPAGSPHGLHLSDQDYKTFLGCESMLATFVTYRGRTLMAMKTSSTPRNLSEDAVNRRIDGISRDYLFSGDRGTAIRRFTEQVCVELGLSLYVTLDTDPTTMRKVVLRG